MTFWRHSFDIKLNKERCWSFMLLMTSLVAPRMNVLFWGPCDFPVSYSTGIPRGTLEIIQEVLRASYSAFWSLPLTNVKWHSDAWLTVTSQLIRLSTKVVTLIPSLAFAELWVIICVLYQFHRQTLPIMIIDRGQIQFREYASTGTTW